MHLGSGGMLLGALPDTTFDEEEVQLEAGDLLVLYTDGLTEARRNGDLNDEMFGAERLEECIGRISPELSAREVLDGLVNSCRGWTGAGELGDDMTLLVLRVLDGHGG
jgi:sigma-B regulation protein RsbU (phosphoserine phosphatase)